MQSSDDFSLGNFSVGARFHQMLQCYGADAEFEESERAKEREREKEKEREREKVSEKESDGVGGKLGDAVKRENEMGATSAKDVDSYFSKQFRSLSFSLSLFSHSPSH